MEPTNIQDPEYFHKVVDCQYACPAHTPVPEYIRLIASEKYTEAYMVNWGSNVFPGVLGRTCETGTVIIDVVQMSGGVKMVVPANWEIKSDITAILGGFDDKRSTPQAPSSGKKLVITGFVMFGGVEIKSYN